MDIEGHASAAPRAKRNYVRSGKCAKNRKAAAPDSETNVPPDTVEQERMVLFDAAFAGPLRQPNPREQSPELQVATESRVQADIANTVTSADARAVAAPESHVLGHEEAESEARPQAEIQTRPDWDDTGAGASRRSWHRESMPPAHDAPAMKSQSEQPSTAATHGPPPDDILDRVLILIEWNPPEDRKVELDVSDWATMADCTERRARHVSLS